MEATVKGYHAEQEWTGSDHTGTILGAAIIGAGIGFIVGAAAHTPREMNTTERLLGGGNRDRILRGLAEFKRGEFLERELVEE